MYRLLSFLLFIFFAYLLVLPFITVNEQKAVETQAKDKPIRVGTELVVKSEDIVIDLPDFSRFVDVKEKKKAFFGYLKPLVEQVNLQIFKEREFIERFVVRPTFANDIKRYDSLAKKYKVDLEQSFEQVRQQLLLKVDGLPIELVLMQAANESGWATSRFALQANNLFGQWCFKKGCGLVPDGRPAGKTYEVRKFKHPMDSVKSYFYNLNTGWAYEELRKIRATMRSKQQPIDATALSEGLLAYSTRREAYVEEIKSMIRINKKYISYE